MLRNYLKIAWRHLVRHKVYTVINVGGLALGLAVALLIGLFVWDEHTRDSFHEHGERIYRLIGHEASDGTLTANLDAPLAPLLEEHLPQIEAITRVTHRTRLVGLPGQQTEQEVLFADPALLEIFSFSLAAGNPRSVLDAPDVAVITEKLAEHVFGTTDALGETLHIQFRRDEIREVTVTGILEPLSPSSLSFDVLLPMQMLPHTEHPAIADHLLTQTRLPIGDTYLLLRPTTHFGEMEELINQIVDTHYDEIPTAFTGAADIDRYSLQALSEVYLTPEVTSRVAASSDPRYSLLLGGIGLLVLLLACINFATLAIGRSVYRAQEVGMRKTLGARPRQIRWQFWSEAFLVTTVALLLGLLLAHLTLPAFNALAERSLTLAPLASPVFLGWMVAGLLLVSLLAAGYPSWILSRFQPTAVLKGVHDGGQRHGVIRALVVVQFALSIALLIGAVVMAQQLRHVQQADLGFDRDQVLLIQNHSEHDLGELVQRLRQELSAYPEIQQVSGMSETFGRHGAPFVLVVGDTVRVSIHDRSVDADFHKTMGIRLVAGRVPLPAHDSDAGRQALVNQALLDAAGWDADDALGQELMMEAGNIRVTAGEIVGVLENFNFHSLHYDIEPLVMTVGTGAFGTAGYTLVRFAPEHTAEAITRAETAWQHVAPDAPFTFRFVDEEIQALYEADQRWAAIIRYAVFLALLISCFGLFGLSALAAQRRTKEIGIRKVLGATIPNIVALLSKDFVKLVVIAFVIATPIAYLAMSRWLEDFAYRIDIGLGVFALAGMIALAIALLTVSYQAIRAALADPVENLRYE